MQEWKACPYCDAPEEKLYSENILCYHQIHCDVCGMAGPLKQDINEAVEAWNGLIRLPKAERDLEEYLEMGVRLSHGSVAVRMPLGRNFFPTVLNASSRIMEVLKSRGYGPLPEVLGPRRLIDGVVSLEVLDESDGGED